MFGTLLNRMILWELIKVFCLSLLAITGLLLMAGIVAEATQRGLSPGQVVAAIPLLIPSTFPYTIPATTLLATCLVYGRLAHDNEITAVRAAGINILHVVRPAVALGLITSGILMGLYYHMIPYTHHLLRTMVVKDVEELLYGMLRRDKCIQHGSLGYAMWVKQVHGKRLESALFKRGDGKGHFDIVALAREAELKVDLPNNRLLVVMRNGEVVGRDDHGYFAEREWVVPLDSSKLTGTGPRRPRAMSWPEILVERDQTLNSRAELRAELDRVTEQAKVEPNSEEVAKAVNSLKFKNREKNYELWGLEAELQMRPALCLGCVCFVLIGCPVGIWLSKNDYLSAFITCFLPIVFAYYPLMLCGTNMAKDGKIPPYISIWFADGLMALIALGLFRKLLKN